MLWYIFNYSRIHTTILLYVKIQVREIILKQPFLLINPHFVLINIRILVLIFLRINITNDFDNFCFSLVDNALKSSTVWYTTHFP